ncbi:DUF6311 domain-containing protein [uncultured Ilyobacter sp.]|uniref:DUF6311 domain-containing protein n=1 Tax=uncultured Ilyobacter sp. TaxID=544433 RepID=UPI0037485EA8
MNKKRMGVIYSSLIGVVIFFTLFNEIIDFKNIDWLLNLDRDPIQHYTGWIFYKNSEVKFPLFSIVRNYGYPYGVPLTFLDSIPLAAFVFKFFAVFIKGDFQYFGLWILICFVLQSCISFLLIFKNTEDFKSSLLCTPIFILAPPLLFRVNFHIALVSQWLILLTFYVLTDVKSKKRSLLAYNILIFLYLTIHPYFFFILTPIIGVDILNKFLDKKISFKELVFICIELLTLIVLILYCLGFFYYGLNSGATSDFGFYSMNFNTFINPFGMSIFLPDREWILWQIEGFAYLGLGIISLILINIFNLRNKKYALIKTVKKNKPYVLLAILYILLASGGTISFDRSFFTINVPLFLKNILGIIRSSGRFIWPLYYLIVLSTLIVFINSIKTRKKYIILMAVVVLQILDLSPGLKAIDKRYENQTWENPLKSEYWKYLAENYKHVVFIGEVDIDNYFPISYFAANNELTLNDGYFARKSSDLISSNLAQKNKFLKGEIDFSTIYVIRDFEVAKNLRLFNTKDSMGFVDKELLYLPNFKTILKNKKYSDKSDINISMKIKSDIRIINVYPREIPNGVWPDKWNSYNVISVEGLNFNKLSRIYFDGKELKTNLDRKNVLTAIIPEKILDTALVKKNIEIEVIEKNDILQNEFSLRSNKFMIRNN